MGASDDGKENDARAAAKAKKPSVRPDAPPTSRLGRLARLGALVPRGIPMAAEAMKRSLGVKRNPEEEIEAQKRVAESAKKTAQAMLKTLGEMKGLPLKLGQMASYIDGLAPPGYEEKFQETLKKLQAKAPPLSASAARKVVVAELGGEPEEIYQTWEKEPFAAASIGQVHRATTKSGDQVAVKVQYPGIDKAIENDLKSLSMLETMIAPVGRRYHTKETLDEVKAVFLAELDYSHEADTAEIFRRIHKDDPEIVIPKVHHALTTRRVLTIEYIEGQDYATFCATASQADKDAAGQTIWRFMTRAMYKHALLYADPHPGNYRFLGGGKVAFLDFGCSKRLPTPLIEGMRRTLIAEQDENWDEFERACIEVFGFDPSDPEAFKLFVGYTKMVTIPPTFDGNFKFTHEYAREAVAYLVRNGKKVVFKPDESLPNLPKPINMPTDHTFVNRLQWGLYSVLAGLGAEANWRKISEPWIRGKLDESHDRE
jgi:predicted unusual protein kinase regulating ubiquinone biosynthesis (AarF/ABC1/UbiB family)